jgi:hypothetical protein
VLALVVAGGGSARAEEPTCPSQDAVERALDELASKDPGKFPVGDVLSSLRLEDLGTRYRITVSGRTRDYDDADRDCERRARVSAVFIALVLSGEEPEPSEKKAVPASPPPEPAPARRAEPGPPRAPARKWFVEAGGRIAIARAESALVVLPGIELGATYEPGPVGGRVVLGVPLASGTLPVGPVTARLARYPLSLGARGVARLSPFALGLDAGVEGALVTVRREDEANGATRPDFGIWAALSLTLHRARLAPYLSVFSEWVPVRHGLALTPDGVLAETPAFWVGAAAGVHFGL